MWGSLIIVLVPTYVTDVATSHGLSSSVAANIPVAAYGVVLIAVILLFPDGIQGAVRRLLGPAVPVGKRRENGSVSTPRRPRPPVNTRKKVRHEKITQPAPGRRRRRGSGPRAGGRRVRLERQQGVGLRDDNTASAPGITKSQILIGSHQPLTGVAAPGYSEIAPAANAYFQYVNAHGGIFGRKIKYTYLDDAYDPSKTVSVVHQLVLQDNVYAIFNGLGTPTHLAVVKFLNSEKIPDVFVASGCDCWNNPSAYPETFGWQLDYIREGKILGAYIKQHFAGKKIGYFFQNDEFGQDGVKGLDMEIPHSQVVSRQSYDPTNINIAPQVAALKAAGAQVVVSFAIPDFIALLRLISLKLSFSPQLVVSNVGTDPTTLGGLLEAFAKKGGAKVNGNQLTQGIITDGYLPSVGEAGNSWITLFKKIHDDLRREQAIRRQRAVWHVRCLRLRPGHAQGRPEPDPG